MKDSGRARSRRIGEECGRFLATHAASIVFASGPLAGSEVELEKARVTLGRGAGADVVLEHASISNEHAALELFDGGFRLRDLGSTNGVTVNGAKVSVADLKHGDRFELGSLSFRYLVAERPSAPPTHQLR
jgi:pSer/pThr/pTyr-binding forkhead associated (FHA) protein